MSLLSAAAFFGLALAGIDVVGGVAAAAMLARGMRAKHLGIFTASYAACVALGTALLLPAISWVRHLLRPVLGSETTWGLLQLAAALGLIGFGWWQMRSAAAPIGAHSPVKASSSKTIPLMLGGAVLAATTLVDPPYLIAVGMAGAVRGGPALRILLLTAWNIVFNLPLLALLAASAFGAHEKLLARVRRFLAARRRLLLLTLGALLFAAGCLTLADSASALLSGTRPWLTEWLHVGRTHH